MGIDHLLCLIVNINDSVKQFFRKFFYKNQLKCKGFYYIPKFQPWKYYPLKMKDNKVQFYKAINNNKLCALLKTIFLKTYFKIYTVPMKIAQ